MALVYIGGNSAVATDSSYSVSQTAFTGNLVVPAEDPIAVHFEEDCDTRGLTARERTRCEVWTRVMGYYQLGDSNANP